MKRLTRDQIAIGNYHYVSWSFDYFLESVQKIGISNIEIWGAKPHLCTEVHSPLEVEELRKKIDGRGLKVICFCPEQNTYPVNISAADETFRRKSLDQMKRAISYTARLGAERMLLCPGNGYLDEPQEAVWERCRASVGELAKTAADYRVTLVLETQAKADSLFLNTVYQQKQMLEEVDHPCVKAMLDTVQMAQFDGSAAEDIEILGLENVRHIHLGNTLLREKTWYEKQLPEDLSLGKSVCGHIGFREGNLPLKDNLEQLSQAGYSDFITIEICQRAYYFEAHRYAKEAYEYTCDMIDLIN